MGTATDDELIRRNPCRIKGAGTEQAKERSTASVVQVDALAEAMGPRWRLMVYFGAYGPMRPEELAALRRTSVSLAPLAVKVTEAAPELTTGRRAEGTPSRRPGCASSTSLSSCTPRSSTTSTGSRRRAAGLLFVGEKGAPFRRSTFGRKWARARTKVGLPEDFRFYDLRHTGHTLSTQSGATLKDTMVRAGQSSEKAAMIYQHSDDERQQEVAGGIDIRVREQRRRADEEKAARDA